MLIWCLTSKLTTKFTYKYVIVCLYIPVSVFVKKDEGDVYATLSVLVLRYHCEVHNFKRLKSNLVPCLSI